MNNYHMRVSTVEWKRIIGFSYEIIPSAVSPLVRRSFITWRFWEKIGQIIKGCVLYFFYQKEAFRKLLNFFHSQDI